MAAANRMKPCWYFNTDESEEPGRKAHLKMIKQSCIAVWGADRFGGAEEVLRKPLAGETVFLYRTGGYGFVASGRVTEESPRRSDKVFGQDDEFHRHLENLRVLPKNRPLTYSELVKRTGYKLTAQHILCKIDHAGAASFLTEYFAKHAESVESHPAAKSTRPAPSRSVALPDDDDEPPASVVYTALRRIRNTGKGEELKLLYTGKCQVCRLRITVPREGTGWYVEVHHLRPLGGHHQGLDNWNNMLVLCPNCHAAFDGLAMALESTTGRVISFHRKHAKHGRKPIFRPNHELAQENVEYHWSRYCQAVDRARKSKSMA